MSDWAALAARVDTAQERVYGEDALWTPAGGLPVDVTVVRMSRVPDDVGVLPQHESVQAVEAQFASWPAEGDGFTVDGEEYFVAAPVSRPDPVGMLHIALGKRGAPAA